MSSVTRDNQGSFLKSFYRRLSLITQFSFSDLRKLRRVLRYFSDMRRFEAAGGKVTHYYPILNDYKKQAGTATGHYFHQDLLVATLINKANPNRHIDVGSSIDGCVAHVAAFRTIEVLDIRALDDCGHERIKFMQANFMLPLNKELCEITDSLSCLHALEHFGLGRYGDPIDPEGHLKGFINLHKMLKPGGALYVSFPIGASSVYFNAHRVFDPGEIIKWSDGLFRLERFDYVDDSGSLHQNQHLESVPSLNYGCGIYTMTKLGA